MQISQIKCYLKAACWSFCSVKQTLSFLLKWFLDASSFCTLFDVMHFKFWQFRSKDKGVFSVDSLCRPGHQTEARGPGDSLFLSKQETLRSFNVKTVWPWHIQPTMTKISYVLLGYLSQECESRSNLCMYW